MIHNDWAMSAALGASALTNYYRNYIAVAVFTLAAIALVVIMLSVGKLIRPDRPESQKYIAYESGSDPVGSFGQSNVRYYIYALLFVIFDVEAVFILPWAIILGKNSYGIPELGAYGMVSMTVFVALLALGLVYAWRKGVLRWA